MFAVSLASRIERLLQAVLFKVRTHPMGENFRYVMTQWLDRETFKAIIDTTPLVSIDMLVRNYQCQILVVKRVNRPAQGFWFVPGGRNLKTNASLRRFLV